MQHGALPTDLAVATLRCMRVQRSAGNALITRDEKARQVEKLVSSSELYGSELLCRLLRYLTQRELTQPGSNVREDQIATDVFGRPSQFEPGLDSTVRIQTARLRAKLAHYYAHEGAGDSLILEIPKGSYAATFRYRAPLEGRLAAVNSVQPEEPVLAPVRSKQREHWVTFLVVAITLALISVAVLGYFLATQSDSIWAPFAADHESPVL